MTAIAIPLILILFILGGGIAGYYGVVHYDIPGAYGILGVMALFVIALIILQKRFPDKR
jgi:hypothetical protein